jgi:serine/threonine-protein kinase HipA
MTIPAITPRNYVPQDALYVWAMVNPAAPTLVGELKLSHLVADCATFAYDATWWQFPLSEDLPLVQNQEFTAGERSSAPGAIDDARPDRWGERIIRHIDRPARLSILEMLLFAGDDRFGALGISVSAEHYIPRHLGPYPRLADLNRLSMAVEDVQTQASITPEIQRLIQPGVSLGGARPKALLQTDAGSCVVKFSELDDAVDTPLVEHADSTASRKIAPCVGHTALRPHRRIPHSLPVGQNGFARRAPERKLQRPGYRTTASGPP